jgi:cobalamin biosynthesis Mg chelatase CobN
VTEPRREDDAPLEREVREAARGESARTPALVIGGVGGLIAVVVLAIVVLVLLIWWLL